MSAYVDDAAIMWKGKARFHMSADSLEELHAFAARIGVKRCWFHRGSRYPHYDITLPQRQAALAAGAVAVSQPEMARLAKRLHVPVPTHARASPVRPAAQEGLFGDT
jgi:hypothetical protein